MFGSGSYKGNKDADTETGQQPASQPNPLTVPAPTAPPLQDSGYIDSGSPGPSSASTNTANSFLGTGTGIPPSAVTKKGATPTPPLVVGQDYLLKIKQEALKNLAPLVNHLEQTPEERFKTLMMLIQASDNPQHLNEAYDAASQIKDEKTRAQALLDVVNEINYFNQQQPPKQP